MSRDFPFEPDPVIEAYEKDVDRTLIRGNPKLTPGQRVQRLIEFHRFAEELRRAGEEHRRRQRREQGRFPRSPRDPERPV
jgi:hypothetical protein